MQIGVRKPVRPRGRQRVGLDPPRPRPAPPTSERPRARTAATARPATQAGSCSAPRSPDRPRRARRPAPAPARTSSSASTASVTATAMRRTYVRRLTITGPPARTVGGVGADSTAAGHPVSRSLPRTALLPRQVAVDAIGFRMVPVGPAVAGGCRRLVRLAACSGAARVGALAGREGPGEAAAGGRGVDAARLRPLRRGARPGGGGGPAGARRPSEPAGGAEDIGERRADDRPLGGERDTSAVGTTVTSRSRSQSPGDRSERDTTVVRPAVASLSE